MNEPFPNVGRMNRLPRPQGTVLIVEDSPTDAELIELVLGGSGLDFKRTGPSNVDEDIRRLVRSKRLACILLDIRLHGATDTAGLDRLRDWKQEGELTRIPVIVVTAYLDSVGAQRFYADGLEWYCLIEKPTTHSECRVVDETRFAHMLDLAVRSACQIATLRNDQPKKRFWDWKAVGAAIALMAAGAFEVIRGCSSSR